MDFERGVPFELENKNDPMESGYSETQQAHDTETKGFDYKNIKKRKPLQQISHQVKILSAFQQIAGRLLQAMTSLSQLEPGNSRHKERILEEIRSLHSLQDELLQCLLLEQRGELSKETTSKEAWNLIE